MITSKNPVPVSIAREGMAWLYTDPCDKTGAGDLIMYKHGMCYTRIYKRWSGIKSRCNCKSDGEYKNYGGRGISIHSEWRYDFMSFYNYVINLPNYSDDLSLDRIDNNGNYVPGNLRWVTLRVQCCNKRPTSSSGFLGVNYNKASNKWMASVNEHGKLVYIGYYNSIIDAVTARDQHIINNELWDYSLQILEKP